MQYGVDEDDEDRGPSEHWEPTKRIRGLAESSTARGLDVLALLVSIYETTDIFVYEYRALLAERLVSYRSAYNIDTELSTLELLKIRFGEEAMHGCEVMLHDVEESKRTNAAVAELLSRQTPPAARLDDPLASFPLDFTAVSEHYWPSLAAGQEQAAAFVLHPRAARWVEAYQAAYTALKKPRALRLLPAAGQVELELDFEDGSSRSFLVSPVQASLILFISDKDSKHGDTTGVTSVQLAKFISLEHRETKSKMCYWIAVGVVAATTAAEDTASQESVLVYKVVESQRERAEAEEKLREEGEDTYLEEQQLQQQEGAESPNGRENSQWREQLCRTIKGLLASQGSMSLERLHAMVGLVQQGQQQQHRTNPVQFRRLVQGMVDTDQLQLISGLYSNA